VNAPPKFILGRLDDFTVVTVSELETGRAFDLVHLKLTKRYQQFDVSGFPPRPDGTRMIAAGERTAFFRCEAMALREAGAVVDFEAG
jgi:hypothetical protein